MSPSSSSSGRRDPPLAKVTAFVTRDAARGARELLAFRHPGEPGEPGAPASLQVPAGTVEPGERPRDAVRRELAEETGLADARIAGEVGRLVHRLGLGRDVPIPGGTWTRGVLPDRVIERDGGRARVAVGEREAWVPAAALVAGVPRTLYHLVVSGDVPDAWTWACDCGAPLECGWRALDGAIALAPPQDRWLAIARPRLHGTRSGRLAP